MTGPRSLLPALPLLGALFAGCSVDAPSQYLVPDLRILAIRDAVPGAPATCDADVGEGVTLEALVANPRSRPSPTVAWFACPPLLTVPFSPCVDPEWLSRPDRFATATLAEGVQFLGAGDAVTASSATLTALEDWPSGVSLTSAFDAKVLGPAVSDPALQCDLYTELPIVAVVTSADGVLEVATKRVRITPTTRIATTGAYTPLRDKYQVNFNPSVAGLRANPDGTGACTGGLSLASPCVADGDCGAGGSCAADGFCAVTLPPGKLTLCAHPLEVFQSYLQCDASGAQTSVAEELWWQWYVSAGDFSQAGFFGNATGSEVDLEPASGPFRLWVILRDGRGGANWIVRDLVAP